MSRLAFPMSRLSTSATLSSTVAGWTLETRIDRRRHRTVDGAQFAQEFVGGAGGQPCTVGRGKGVPQGCGEVFHGPGEIPDVSASPRGITGGPTSSESR